MRVMPRRFARPRSRLYGLLETAVLLAVAIVLALTIQAYAVKPYKIPSGSMEPTLQIGDRVLVNRFAHRVLGHEPQVGDIVVFTPPTGADDAVPHCGAAQQGQGTATPCSRPTPQHSSQTFIKRVVAVGGDRLALRDGHVVRNGHAVSEPFIRPCDPAESGCQFPNTITVPRGYVYVLGDNRGDSDDSRFWGPVPERWVIGKAFATYWPLGRMTTQ
jgi:signal peptidase I